MVQRLSVCVALVVLAACALVASGCSANTDLGPRGAANAETCGGGGCHDDYIRAGAEGAHASLACDRCHKGTGEAHRNDPAKAVATTEWTIASCAECHEREAVTYLYDDNTRVGPFGGSQTRPYQAKTETFPEYNKIVAGHAFAKDYNEEGAHGIALEQHYDTRRMKFESCLQCKSTKIALAFKNGKKLTVPQDTKITLAHTASGTVPAKVVTIPQGTTITYATDSDTRFVDARATFPDGTSFTSRPPQSEDATLHYNMVWASSVAAIEDTMPYGAGCNHCHDPHSGRLRLVRQAMLDAIETSGTAGRGGVNPYREGSPTDPEKASAQDRRVLSCAQCHVEYVCGKSGVDGNDRDFFPWAKAKDLHDLYQTRMGYAQDWKQSIIGEPLIKSQHPETELYWDSTHYNAGASCGDCHMPLIRDGSGEEFRSHWFTSPFKYRDPKTSTAFAAKTGMKATPADNPCVRCHADRTARAIAGQREFFALQSQVETLLAQSVDGLGLVKRLGADRGNDYDRALELHRKAHVVWENLAVSENSMGFHNFGEVMSSMAQAKKDVAESLVLQRRLISRSRRR